MLAHGACAAFASSINAMGVPFWLSWDKEGLKTKVTIKKVFSRLAMFWPTRILLIPFAIQKQHLHIFERLNRCAVVA